MPRGSDPPPQTLAGARGLPRALPGDARTPHTHALP
eukprot:CAMPEP_0183355454 /NCGR_PEP_ID=MMETSP0164_2-20130417/40466_1 /TAXON_ID=221442 /ORGANISM="Coccolithus pelagicus ssp braarudi, Strain PLY182g" /LENGTH=35 /DNA_ID= /DNA_START= /DNA_END= /DNA_ORIENTATION=